MKKATLSLIFVHLSMFLIGQTVVSDNKSELNNYNISDKPVKQLRINTSNYSQKTLEEIKDEFDGWKEKVISLEINEKTQQLVLIHNKLMERRELFEVLNKYAIKKEDIISYK
jgi:hypothetical protein